MRPRLFPERLGTALLATVFVLSASHLHALPVRYGHVEAELVSESASIVPGQPLWVAVRLRMDPEWHTYWQNPGDSGLPTSISWNLPAGFSAGPIQWPSPRLNTTLGVTTYGYEGEVGLLVEITPSAELAVGTMKELRAQVSWLVCREVCQPGRAELRLTIPVTARSGAPDPRTTDLFRAFRSELPQADPSLRFAADLRANDLTLRAEGIGNADPATARFYPAQVGLASSSTAQDARIQRRALVIRVPRGDSSEQKPARLQGVLEFSQDGHPLAVLVDTPLGAGGAAQGPSGAGGSGLGVLAALFFAFLGGIILNLMPCVLPVLSLKVMSFISESSASKRKGVAHGLVYSAGVIVSFWLVVGLLLALRAAGQTLGWGFQLQNPIVVAVLALLFFILGLSMFGVFEIGTRLTALGSAFAARSGWAGSFFSGLLAVAVATPCTAPFMGTALGYALSQRPVVVFGVFTSLAIGMSFPYVLLTLVPKRSRWIPRSGKWMETLKQVLGFPLMASAAWMAMVLLALSGPTALAALFAALVVSAAGAWVFGRWGGIDRNGRTRVIVAILAIAMVTGSLFLVIRAARSNQSMNQGEASAAAPEPAGPRWERFTPARLAELRARGTPVFIDFTAAWCLTCQVNERVALRDGRVDSRFQELGMVKLKADWTDRNDEIEQAIEGYGRAGVPLYVVYARGTEQPMFLPEILTPGIVLGSLSKLH